MNFAAMSSVSLIIWGKENFFGTNICSLLIQPLRRTLQHLFGYRASGLRSELRIIRETPLIAVLRPISATFNSFLSFSIPV